MLRFDFFIHRQAAYLRQLETQLTQEGISIPLWETWKTGLRSTIFVIPLADTIASAVVVLPTVYILFGPAQRFLDTRHRVLGKAYAWFVTVLLIVLLGSLAMMPRFSQWRD